MCSKKKKKILQTTNEIIYHTLNYYYVPGTGGTTAGERETGPTLRKLTIQMGDRQTNKARKKIKQERDYRGPREKG